MGLLACKRSHCGNRIGFELVEPLSVGRIPPPLADPPWTVASEHRMVPLHEETNTANAGIAWNSTGGMVKGTRDHAALDQCHPVEESLSSDRLHHSVRVGRTERRGRFDQSGFG